MTAKPGASVRGTTIGEKAAAGMHVAVNAARVDSVSAVPSTVTVVKAAVPGKTGVIVAAGTGIGTTSPADSVAIAVTGNRAVTVKARSAAALATVRAGRIASPGRAVIAGMARDAATGASAGVMMPAGAAATTVGAARIAGAASVIVMPVAALTSVARLCWIRTVPSGRPVTKAKMVDPAGGCSQVVRQGRRMRLPGPSG